MSSAGMLKERWLHVGKHLPLLTIGVAGHFVGKWIAKALGLLPAYVVPVGSVPGPGWAVPLVLLTLAAVSIVYCWQRGNAIDRNRPQRPLRFWRVETALAQTLFAVAAALLFPTTLLIVDAWWVAGIAPAHPWLAVVWMVLGVGVVGWFLYSYERAAGLDIERERAARAAAKAGAAPGGLVAAVSRVRPEHVDGFFNNPTWVKPPATTLERRSSAKADEYFKALVEGAQLDVDLATAHLWRGVHWFMNLAGQGQGQAVRPLYLILSNATRDAGHLNVLRHIVRAYRKARADAGLPQPALPVYICHGASARGVDIVELDVDGPRDYVDGPAGGDALRVPDTECPIDFDSPESINRTLDGIVDHAQHRYGEHCRLRYDITGGTKTLSMLVAAHSVARPAEVQWVDTNPPYNVETYNLDRRTNAALPG